MFGCRVMLANVCVSYSCGAHEKPSWHPHFHGTTAGLAQHQCQGRQGTRKGSQGWKEQNSSTSRLSGHHWGWWQTQTRTLPADICLAQHTFPVPVLLLAGRWHPSAPRNPHSLKHQRHTITSVINLPFLDIGRYYLHELKAFSKKSPKAQMPKTEWPHSSTVLPWVQLELTSLLPLEYEVNSKNICLSENGTIIS